MVAPLALAKVPPVLLNVEPLENVRVLLLVRVPLLEIAPSFESVPSLLNVELFVSVPPLLFVKLTPVALVYVPVLVIEEKLLKLLPLS